MADLLVEVGLEEIPARMIAGAEAELGRRVADLLKRERLSSETPIVTTYSTPRRLAVRVEGVAASQPDAEEQLLGPSWKIAFPTGQNDNPGPAAIAFAKKAGIEVTAIQKLANAKGEYASATVLRKGRAASELLAAELPKEILSIYWAKNMYWRANKPERFVRPLRWLVALLDTEVIPLEIAGIAAGNTTRGHRILHGEAPVSISSPAAYQAALQAAFVEPDVAARRHTIRKALDHVTRAIAETPKARWREDEALVDTVVHLTEWPTVLHGSFEPEYLALPEEVLVTVMRDHQKYFAVEDSSGKLAPHFLTILNTQVDAEGQAIIRHGNERVLRSRFKDAQFFWGTDQKIPLKERVELLKTVTFQKELGSYYWKTKQNLNVAKSLYSHVEAVLWTIPDENVDWGVLTEATLLAKTDLTTELVKEFTELQGVIGRVYSIAQGMDERVAIAIGDQYIPASSEGPIPSTCEGQLLGIADRIQTITAMFGIGNIPSGSKDPFALRRAANGIVKILAESSLPVGLTVVLNAAATMEAPRNQLNDFFAERLSFYLKDVRGFAYDVVAAVMTSSSDDVRDAIARAEAVSAVRGSEDFVAIAAAFKRIKNILRQAAERNETPEANYDFAPALKEHEERALLTASVSLAAEVATLRQQHNYAAALEAIATLRPTVDAFFDKVMVMSPEPQLRSARLALIRSVLENFSGIADFSEIVVA